MYNETKISKTRSFSLANFMSEEQRTSGLCSAAHSVLCGSHNKRMCVCEKRGRRKREGERDLKPTSTSYSSEGATTEIGI